MSESKQAGGEQDKAKRPRPLIEKKAAYIIAGGMVLSAIIVVIGFSPNLIILALLVIFVALPIVLIAGPNHWFDHPRDPGT